MNLKIIGQFNKGFIVATLGSELFILDQHACDERKGLEAYEKSLKIDCQALIKPLRASVSKHQANLILKYDFVFEHNGMKIQLARSYLEREDCTMVPIRVVAMPQSEGTQFQLSDFFDLVQGVTRYQKICDGSNTEEVLSNDQLIVKLRIRKVQQILATKACRNAVMVGHVLSIERCEEIVRGLRQLRNPWICAHGRPTMRYLFDLTEMKALHLDTQKTWRHRREAPQLL